MVADEIPNEDVKPSDIPPRDAHLYAIWSFALTYDGYARWGSFADCAAIANARRHRDLDDLRTCLFFEQRRWRHFDEDPDPASEAYIRDLVERIRAAVADTAQIGQDTR